MNCILHDSQVFDLIAKEEQRQQDSISLIASENYTYPEVLLATASMLTNKYAEGYPGKRYYGGCAVVDQLESLAQERCKKLFNAEHVNVQPHSGSQANAAVLFAILKPGDTILGMSLAEGGHLTHGHKVNFSGTLFNAVQYSVDSKTHLLNYDAIEEMAIACRPKLIIAGASAYSRVIDFQRFGAIAKKVGACLLADIAHIAGLIVAGLHPHPFPHADFVTSTTHKTLRGPRGGIIMCKKEYAAMIDKAIIPGMQGGPLMHVIAAKAVGFGKALEPAFVEYQKNIIANAKAMATAFLRLGYPIITGGTDNHLMVIDLSHKNITGKDAEIALEKSGINVSRSCIPFDKQKPALTSGIRVGTSAITARGFKQEQMTEIVQLIDACITNWQNEAELGNIKEKVRQLCMLFPINAMTMHGINKHSHMPNGFQI